MPLSWNEIKTRSLAFSKEWQMESAEDAEAKSFWDSFSSVFGISRKRVANFEEPEGGDSLMKKQDLALYCPLFNLDIAYAKN